MMNSKNLSKTKYIRGSKNFFFWIFFFLSIFIIAYGGFLTYQQQQLIQESEASSSVNWRIPSMKAVSYLVGRLDTGQVIIQKNDNLQLFTASLSKLMTAMVVIDNVPPSTPIPISAYAVSTEGKEGDLCPGETMTAQDLLKVLLIPSSNDAATAFEQFFHQNKKSLVSLMQAKARQLGMYNSAFFDDTGLDREGNFTTARDLFKLAKEVYYHYPLIGQITRTKRATVISRPDHKQHILLNTDKLISNIKTLWGGKTGSTPDAQDCLLTIYEYPLPNEIQKVPIAIIVIHSRDRFGDTRKLYKLTQTIYGSH